MRMFDHFPPDDFAVSTQRCSNRTPFVIGEIIPKFALCVVGLTWLASVSVVAAEPSEREELKQIFAIMKKAEHEEFYDQLKLIEVYQEVHQQLASLKVSESNRSLLLQARTLTAVLGQQWDDFASLAKEFDEKHYWFLQVKTWQLQMRVAREDWKTLTDDVTWLVDYLIEKQVNLGFRNQPTEQVGYKLLMLRQALTWPKEEELPHELKSVTDQIDRLQDLYAKAHKGRPGTIYPGFAEDFEWLSQVKFLSSSFTKEQFTAMIADQRSSLASARAEAKIAGKERGAAQANRSNRGEDEYWETRRRSRSESQKLALLAELERTAKSHLGVAFRARLWFWQWSEIQNTEYVKSNWQFGLVDKINRKP